MAPDSTTARRRVLITGANRGIGLELTKTFLNAGDDVWGSARPGRTDQVRATNPAGVIEMDLADEESIVAGMSALGSMTDGLDLLINCAGIDARAVQADEGLRGPFDLDGDTFTQVTRVNVTGPMIVTREALDLLRAGTEPVLVNISSQLGSMDFARNAGSDTSYCVSKAGLNMLSVKAAAALEPDGVCVVALHPGWVSSDMGGRSAPLTPAESAAEIHRTVTSLTMADTGRFITWDGRTHAW
jgi:NAD(P)-dependent dehydrogenase (short-subunit alcohol dehydrogenase family)